MNFRLIHLIGFVLILLATVESATVLKSDNKTTTDSYEDQTKKCSLITTREECLESPCSWCETECTEHNNLNMIKGKSSKCLAGEATYEHEELTLKYGGLHFWILGAMVLVFCCCGCFCCGCLLG